MEEDAPLRQPRLNRLFSEPLTRFLMKTPATPNQVTTVSLILGIFSGFLFSKGAYLLSLAAALVYQLVVILDNCDGEIARLKNLRSEFGGWLDVWADLATDIALFTGIGLGAWHRGVKGPVLPFTILCLSGATLHFLIVVIEKVRGFGPAVYHRLNPDAASRRHLFFYVFDALREGNVSWFALIFAVMGKIHFVLWVGGVYMQVLWISALVMDFKWLFAKNAP